MTQRRPYRAQSSATYRPNKRRGSARASYLRVRDFVLLGAVAVAGLGSVTGWLGESQTTGPQGLVSAQGASAFYRYCSDAREAGAAPLHVGDPGYRSELDRDGDGVACEPYSG